jgi:2,4-dienoyl-CoA reductase-like NADH-dependent reductase (Old Yellow Enzyme family)
MSQLFSPFNLRGLTFRNRVFVSPMCQYSSDDGMPNTWHLVHLGSRAIGGAGLVMVEATAVSPEGRISPADSGLWNDQQADAFRKVAYFIRSSGAVPAIQLAHAGRKASTEVPWKGGRALTEEEGGWEPIGPSPKPFYPTDPVPREMLRRDIDAIVARFTAAAHRAFRAGFQVVEVHAAHGYLLHEFLSPLSNFRNDDYGGSLENRMRLTIRVAQAVRDAWPQEWPVFVRLSASDWMEGGWDLPQSISLARALKAIEVDLIDCSTGGNVPRAPIPVGPGYQVPFAEAIRREADIATGAVGQITFPKQAEEIVAQGRADVVFLARAMLRDPYWPLHAAEVLGADPPWPDQYERARLPKPPPA